MRLNILLATELYEQFNKKNYITKTPTELYSPRNYIMDMPGKKIRALLTMMGCALFDGGVEKAVEAALCVELFHNFTLVHDDIMDNASLRRGMPAVHVAHGTNAAILTGDVMLIEVYERLSNLTVAEPLKVIQYFNQTAREVCEGQSLDMNFETRSIVSMAEYLDMIELKTAVLLGLALRLGAIIAGAERTDHEHLYQFAKNAGVCFQIQDDYLDIYGDPTLVGKKLGGDIVQSKKNYFYVKACELLEGDVLKSFIQLYTNTNLPEKLKIQQVLDVYDELYLSHYCKEAKESFFALASSHLQMVRVDNERKADLLTFAETLMNRKS